ncbi:uncharacterized protein LOC127834857 isoform X4 [Dreissena polymorpha]|uniref:uncharacterized protein LOC127834857 isoform X4 n=1 Tax=Dreissena polymorpha TaxID=45954 RepID=UPI0022652FE9|nr:uncharacterized protein LOC127834857 isoform X4 [Dreissena polymorpha]
MGFSVVNCICFIIELFLLKGYKASPTLTVDVNDVFVNNSITLTCSTSFPPKSVVWWMKEGSKDEEKVIAQWLDADHLCRTDNNAMDCSCLSKYVYSCSIKSVNSRNDGQSWRCKAFDGIGLSISKSYTIRLIFPLTSLTILPETSVAYPVFNVVSTFTCITSLSRPVASIQWFNDNINITHLAYYSHIDDVARSDLQFIPNANGYIGGNISCVASYEFKSISNVLSANISIRVQYPVSNLIVTINNLSISTDFSIREDRLVQLNCFSTGYPQPSYNWTYSGGRFTGAVLNCTFTRNNGSVSCKAYNVMRTFDGINSAEATEKNIALKINVLYPPVITKLSSNDKSIEINNSTIRVQRGDNINIVCTSDANPLATVFWNGQLIDSPTLTVISVQHDAVWTCQATNTMTEFDGVISTSNVTRNVSARVLYGPGVPTITYTIPTNSDALWNALHDPIKVIVGSTIILMCSVDSVPNSTYTWDTGHKGSILTIVNVTRTTNTRHICMAKNVMDTSFKGNVIGSNTSFANLDILYGPSTIALMYNNVTPIKNEFKVIEGWSFKILCSASSNPAPRYTWSGHVAQQGNALIIRNVRTDIERNVTCKAENTMTDSGGKSVVGTTLVTVSMEVLYPPDVQRLQNQTVLLNNSLTVVCNLTRVGNPPASNYSWIRKDIGRVIGTGKTLIINNIRLADEGEYQCNASNRMQPITNEVLYGLSQSTVYINVEYGAYVREFKSNQSHNSIAVNQGETVDLLCVADGDPEPVLRVMNTTRGNESIMVEIKAREAKYRIQQAQCEYDTGNYTCLADNRYNEGRQLFALLVYCVPRASPFSLPTTTLSSAPNDSVLFTFTIIAYPKPTLQDVIWYKRENDSWRVLSDDNNFLITLSVDSMQTQLNIFHVQLEDYSDYMVNVSNKLGSTMEVFTLKAQSKPEIPKESQISRIGKTELIVEWIPGFNGGETQTFTIRYKVLGDGSWIIIPINISKHIWTIDGLASGITYQIQIRAQNKIGESDWTQAINITTLVDAVDKGSTSSAVGGSIGGAAGVVLIVAVIVVIWRHRIKEVPKSDLKKILTRRLLNQSNGAYENIGMVKPREETKQTKKEMESSCSVIDGPRSCKVGNKLAPCLSENQIHSSDQRARKLVPVYEDKQSEENSSQFTAGIQRIIKHNTVISDISGSTVAAPSTDTFATEKQDSYLIEHDPIYDNIYKKKTNFNSRTIRIENLREIITRDKNNKTDVFTEFSALSVASETIKESTNAAIKTANTSKNRYRNMYPYDKNRVILSVIGNDVDTDFINASFIDGYSSPKNYIAAQGPLADTIADFWRMVWENNVRVVVMVTNLVEDSKRKCIQYWPKDAANNCQYGDSTIHLLSEDIHADFVVRTLECNRKGSSKTITHLHFTAWPDKDVPDTALSLLQFWRKVRSLKRHEESPWIVHCSAGVGRTGTFIALDYLYDQGVSEKHINVFDAVLLLREQRINMVQTKNQYLYLHEVLCEALCPVGEVVYNKTFFNKNYTTNYLNEEYMTICRSHIAESKDETVDDIYMRVLDGEKPENIDKNIDPCVIPDDKYRPVLNMAVNTRGHTDYINAVYLSTFKEGDRLILTQSANISSDVDFVQLLHDHYVRTVVTIGDKMEPYLPENEKTIVIGPFTALSISFEQKQHFEQYFVRFKHIGEQDGFDVLVFRFTNWSQQLDLCPANELLSLLNEVQKLAATDGPVVIQCHDGYSRSGLVAVLWCLMERSKHDGEVAVAETVRLIRRRRQQVIRNEEQYRFCHEFMKSFVEGCAVYTKT